MRFSMAFCYLPHCQAVHDPVQSGRDKLVLEDLSLRHALTSPVLSAGWEWLVG